MWLYHIFEQTNQKCQNSLVLFYFQNLNYIEFSMYSISKIIRNDHILDFECFAPKYAVAEF